MRLQLLRQQAAAGASVLRFGDEAEVLTHPYLAHRWSRRGADLRLQAPGQAERRALLGVLDAATDELLVGTSATKCRADLIALPGDLDRRSGPAADRVTTPVVLVLDRGTIHTSKASRAALEARPWRRVAWLPTYAPELNAIERCWRDRKRHDLANQTFRDGADLERRARAAVHRRNLDRAPHLWPILPQAA